MWHLGGHKVQRLGGWTMPGVLEQGAGQEEGDREVTGKSSGAL